MNRPPFGIFLQDENARSSRRMRIVLHDHRRRNAGNHVADEYIIGGKLVIAMRRNSNLSAIHEHLHPT